MSHGAGDVKMLTDLLARIAAATVGGYAFCYSAAAAASRVLPMARSEVVLLTSFVAILGIVPIAIWAFGCRSILRTWTMLGLGSMALFAFGFWWPA